MIAYSRVMTGTIEVRYIRKGEKTRTQSSVELCPNKLKGHILKMGCTETGKESADCWIHTSQNLIYSVNLEITHTAGGDLSFADKRINKYNVGLNQFITGCSITSGFLVCTSDDLSSKDPEHKSSILVFRTYADNDKQNLYLYARVPAKDIKGITPFISTIDFSEVKLRDLLRRARILEKTGNLQAGTPKSQKAYMLGSGSDTAKKYSMQIHPTLIHITKDNINKDPKFKEIKVVAKSTSGDKKAWLFSKFVPNPKPPKPVVPSDGKKENTHIPGKEEGMGYIGWFVVFFMILLVGYGIWFFMRREKLKEQAREDLIYNTNELERYD